MARSNHRGIRSRSTSVPSGFAMRSLASGHTGDRKLFLNMATGTRDFSTARSRQSLQIGSGATRGDFMKITSSVSAIRRCRAERPLSRVDGPALGARRADLALQARRAKYFVALANHHDNFDCFNSKFQPWNSVNVGPKRDVVGTWQKAARAAGLRFGVSVHASRTWSWFEASRASDMDGPKKGVPYDGNLTKIDGKGTWWEGLDPQDLYCRPHPVGAARSGLYRQVPQPHDRPDRFLPAGFPLLRRRGTPSLRLRRAGARGALL